jgi:ATP-dependent DNA helicase RecG
MRPSVLDPLFAAAAGLPGVGPKTGKLLARLLAEPEREARLVDLLFHLPHAAVDRRVTGRIADAPLDTVVTLEVEVVEHRPPPPRGRAPYRVLVADETGDCLLVFFLTNHRWIESSLKIGARRWVSGRLELWNGYRQMVHPDRVLDADGFARMRGFEPVYGLTEGLSGRILQKATEAALARLPNLPEWNDWAKLAMRPLPSFAAALAQLHTPARVEDVAVDGPAWTRLALDELIANQLALALMRARMRRTGGRPSAGDGRLARSIAAALPFRLTPSQTRALAEIGADLAAPRRMLRLLQGDVGSGKTLVALFAMAQVVEAGRQAALMAPTEVLARQHFASLQDLAAAAGMSMALLTGRDTPAARKRTLAALADGSLDIVVGTHALVQESVAFRDLALAVVDEQHRFGVHQRLALGGKGDAVDILVMTATPIPRTLVLSYFGDMDVSTLPEKPPGRTPIETAAVPLERMDDMIARLGKALDAGARAYWVCPLVVENESVDLAAVEERHAALKAIFGDRVGLVHGQMKGREKDAAMADFAEGRTQLLVATTVIEVGVDVPEATIMVIEHAERFGLAQMHQLRGRVGRGAAKSSCLLLFKGPLGDQAKARIDIMRETQDGFRIAEEDLRLRGEGEVLGTRQAGTPGFRVARLEVHANLLPLARAAARRVLEENPRLEGVDGDALRVLLYLFERDEALRLVQAG